MCGIAGIHRRTDKPIRNLGALADALLLGIAHRGSDATGLLAQADDGSRHLQKLTLPCAQFVLCRERLPKDARTVLLHTRLATRGRADDPRNAHPVVAGHIAAIHNGTIYNDRDVFKRYGWKRTAEVDSIVIPEAVRHHGWDKAAAALGELDGGMATAILNAEAPDELILARLRSYPLHALVTDSLVVWASERQAVALAMRKAFGGPPRGTWLKVGDYEMIHVNGTVSGYPIKPRPVREFAPKTTTPKLTLPKPKKQQKPKQRKQMTFNTAAPPQEPVEDARVVEESVTDLMRWAGCSYAEAYEEVTGRTLPDYLPDFYWEDDEIRFGTGGSTR